LYAGIKTEHDEDAYRAIESSDLLVFCITSSLFDDVILNDFINLAYKRAYKNKIMIVVNKMSLEDGVFEELRENYYQSLMNMMEEQGADINDFTISFIDAKDYREGIAENDEELIEMSHFDSFVDALNKEIESKGLCAKIVTKCNILSDAIGMAVANVGTEADQNLMIILNRLERSIKQSKRDMRSKLKNRENLLRSTIMNLGNEITDLIGEEDIKQEKIDEINSNIEEAIDIALTDIENMLGEIIEEMMDSMDGVISSDRARYVFDNIQNNEFSAKSVMAIDLHLFVDNYLGVEKYIRDGGEFLAKAALKDA